MLTQERLKEVIHYDPETGVFTWIKKTSNYSRVNIGDKITSINNHGYIHVKVDGGNYKVHRLAFLYMIGKNPMQVDHINGVRNDNRWVNLRECNASQNSHNKRKPQGNNPYLGVNWKKARNRWSARITVNGKRKCIGEYLTPEEARDAYINAKKELHNFDQF